MRLNRREKSQQLSAPRGKVIQKFYIAQTQRDTSLSFGLARRKLLLRTPHRPGTGCQASLVLP